MCPGCGKPVADCVCRKARKGAEGDGIVRIRRESKGRGGKTVTVVSGLPLDEEGMKKLASELKRRCGTGGTVRDNALEIQGDQCDFLKGELEMRGFVVKRAGG
jgi:translation initiation factor 1